MAYTFDGTTKRITLLGVTSLSIPDMYSRYKEWVLAGNSSSLPAFSTVGGDIDEIPLYLFLLNGWRIVPMSSDHTLTVLDGVLGVFGGGDPFVDPVGSYKIRINRQTPGIAIGYSTNGGSLSAGEVANAVWTHTTALDFSLKLAEAWGRLGLDPSKPLISGQAEISFGDIVLALSGTSTVTLTRE